MLRITLSLVSLISFAGFIMACNPKQMGRAKQETGQEKEFEARVREMIRDLDHVEQSELLPEIEKDSQPL